MYFKFLIDTRLIMYCVVVRMVRTTDLINRICCPSIFLLSIIPIRLQLSYFMFTRVPIKNRPYTFQLDAGCSTFIYLSQILRLAIIVI
ncbi:hypothetical protein BDF21DRAFT_419753 [Thamnidium elegans]|nr:hypothetical protein BDF21DRAFT_419753 [Thamnidium elegans]